MQAIYQIHAGVKYAGSLARDAAMIFEKINLAHASAAFDLRHIRAGSGPSFEMSVALLKEHLGSVYVKDVQWTGPRSKKL